MPTTGIEPVTFALRERRSTTELNRHVDNREKIACQQFDSSRNSISLCSVCHKNVSWFVKLYKLKGDERSIRMIESSYANIERKKEKKREIPSK